MSCKRPGLCLLCPQGAPSPQLRVWHRGPQEDTGLWGQGETDETLILPGSLGVLRPYFNLGFHFYEMETKSSLPHGAVGGSSRGSVRGAFGAWGSVHEDSSTLAHKAVCMKDTRAPCSPGLLPTVHPDSLLSLRSEPPGPVPGRGTLPRVSCPGRGHPPLRG